MNGAGDKVWRPAVRLLAAEPCVRRGMGRSDPIIGNIPGQPIRDGQSHNDHHQRHFGKRVDPEPLFDAAGQGRSLRPKLAGRAVVMSCIRTKRALGTVTVCDSTSAFSLSPHHRLSLTHRRICRSRLLQHPL